MRGRRTWEIGARAPSGLRIAIRTAYRDSDDKFVADRPGSSATFNYDAVGRLAGIADVYTGGTSNLTVGFGHNPANQIVSQSRNNDVYAWQGHYAVNRPYTTDGLNRYTAAGAAGFTYDFNGNLTSDGSRTFTYDIENRLVGASGGVTLRYDPLGRLHELTAPSGTTQFLYDGDALVGEYVNNLYNMTVRYVHGADAGADDPLIWYSTTATHYLHRDHQGSIIAAAANAGTVVAINRYDEYGIPAAANQGRFQYTGQIWLPELGMYHYKARIYSPYIGRFLQTDPIGYDDQFNLYAYVGNDPVNLTDPTGMELCRSCSGYTIEVGSANLAAARRRNDSISVTAAGSNGNAAQSRAGPTLIDRLRSCRTSNPDDMCGMIQDRRPRAMATMRGLTAQRTPGRATIHRDFGESERDGNERGIWMDDNLDVLARRNGGRDHVDFYPIPPGGTIFAHFHGRTISEGYFPGLSRQDRALAINNNVMMIVLSDEFNRYYWLDSRR